MAWGCGLIVLTGLSHHTADISIREQVALTIEEEAQLTNSLLSGGKVAEVFVVSTCNRVEIVALSANDSEQAVLDCVQACRSALHERSARAKDSVYSHRDIDAVRHLIKVACSLDSLVVGEAQILGQIKKGYERAKALSAVGSGLHQLIMRVIRAAKRVRNETNIGMGQVSVPSIAVDLAMQIFGELSGRHVVLVGAGDMGQSVARLLREAGAQVKVVGRNLERVGAAAREIGASAHLMDELAHLLVDAEVVVSSTSATVPIITKDSLSLRQKKRRGANLFCIDLAVPRDIEPAVGRMDGVFLYDVDDLSQVATQSAQSRRKEADAAMLIVEQMVSDWERHTQAQQVTPTIKALRAKLRLGFEAELEKTLRTKLKDLGPEQRSALSKMLDAGISRVLHAPITHLRQEAYRSDVTGAEEFAGMLTELFDLADIEPEELDVPSVRLSSSSSSTSSGAGSVPSESSSSSSDDSSSTNNAEAATQLPSTATHIR